jgi:hypothetical protein
MKHGFCIEKIDPFRVTITKYTGNTETVVVPGKIQNCKVVSIGEYAFGKCECIEHITLPNTIEDIKQSAFEKCNNLKSIKMPSRLMEIGNDSFFGCSSLAEITIPNTVYK